MRNNEDCYDAHNKIKFETDILDVLRRHGYIGDIELNPRKINIRLKVYEVPEVEVFYTYE